MSAAESIDEVMRRYGREDFLALAEGAGLKRVGGRIQCPFPGCADQGPQRNANVSVTQGKDGCWHLRCWRCDARGRYVDLYMAVKGLALPEALEQLRGHAALTPSRPTLRVVPPPGAVDEGRMRPDEVQRVWQACREADEAGEAYLAKRALHECVAAGLVRFAWEGHPHSTMARQAKAGYRLVALLRDLSGNARGIQLRLARETLPSDRSKVTSLKGSTLGGAWFGRPELFEGAGVVVVAEGLADTLAAARWVGDWDGACVLGAPGKSNLHRLVEEARAIGLDVAGRVFVLLAQNDRPVNASRREFDRLAKQVTGAGGQVVWCNVPEEVKDFAQWAQEAPQEVPAWPPVDVRRALGLEAEGGAEEERLVTPIAGALPVPARFTNDESGQDFGTLLAALDDPGLRFAILRRKGEWAWNEMSQRPGFGRTDLSVADWVAIRAGLEAHVRSSTGKKLRWGRDDIVDAVTLLARRASWHPVREYLNALTWDGHPRLESDFARAMGLEEYGFHAALLRRWAISAVARVMRPGCKVDTMLVLVGPQGTGKSTLFSVLGGAFFSDQAIDLHDKDGRMVLHSAWLLEWAELDSMRRARDADAIKAFLTQRVDKFRPPYGREIIEAPRSCVIVGTTNNAEFLTDPTGNRRFWPVPVASKVDLPAVSSMRDQLWAEALAAYVAGEEWHLDGDMERMAAHEVAAYVESDSWEPLVRGWLVGKEGRAPLSTADVLAEVIEKPVGQWTRADEMRVGRILSRLGWERRRFRRGSKLYWGYVPTDDVVPTSRDENE